MKKKIVVAMVQNKGLYIHIPFCESMCSYCDFSKFYYNSSIVNKYLNSLEKEIKENYKDEEITSIYIGGGTPSSLSINELKKLFSILRTIKKADNIEFTFECNPENMSIDKIKLLKNNGVNRVSIGVQSFDNHILKLLNRNHSKDDVFKLVDNLKQNGIFNINIDLIFGIKNQTIDSIRNDLDHFIKLAIPHISYYSLILEEHTKLYIDKYDEIDDDTCALQYEFVCNYLKSHNYSHYEISNFAKVGYESKHNLVYWNNEHYYGFGCGAHGFINNIRYENTRSITKYNNGNYVLDKHELDVKEDIENQIMLNLRTKYGINKSKFYDKYNKDLTDLFDFRQMIEKGLIVDSGDSFSIPEKYFFISNQIILDIIMGGEDNDRNDR